MDTSQSASSSQSAQRNQSDTTPRNANIQILPMMSVIVLGIAIGGVVLIGKAAIGVTTLLFKVGTKMMPQT